MGGVRGWSEVAIAALAGLLVALLFGIRAFRRPRRQLPPGPAGWPILGSLPLLGTLPHQSLYELSKKYGPLMFMRLGSINTLVVSSPRFAEEILRTHDKNMASRPLLVATRAFFYDSCDVAWAPYGKYWRYVRKVCTMGLLTATRITAFQEIRKREVMSMLHFILEEAQRGNTVDLSECFEIITFNNITQMMMNQSFCVPTSGTKSAHPKSTAPLPEYIREMFGLLGAFNLADYIPLLRSFDPQGLQKRMKDVHGKIDKFIEGVIEEHRQRRSTAKTEDFVDALLGFGQTKEFEERLHVNSIKSILLDMISGGGDTSSVAAHWALTELLKQPHTLRKAREELDSVVGPDQLVQEHHLPELVYITAVIKETLRLHPPGPLLIPHQSVEDCEIAGFHVPGGTRIYINVWGLQRDPAVWERPLDFDPDRFLNSAKEARGQDFGYLPFGYGRRACPGMNLGMLMVLYPLALLLHALDWVLPEGQKAEELDTSETFGLVVYKKVPLKLFGKARLPHDVLYPAQEKVA